MGNVINMYTEPFSSSNNNFFKTTRWNAMVQLKKYLK